MSLRACGTWKRVLRHSGMDCRNPDS